MTVDSLLMTLRNNVHSKMDFSPLSCEYSHICTCYMLIFFLTNGKIISYSYYLSLYTWIWLIFCISTIVQWITLWSTSFILCNVFKVPLWYALTKTSSIFFLTAKEYCTKWLPSQDQLPLGLTKCWSVISWCSFPFSYTSIFLQKCWNSNVFFFW